MSMKAAKRAVIGVLCSTAILFDGTELSAQSPVNTLIDSASYAIGLNFAVTELLPAFEELEKQRVDINPEVVGVTIQNQLLDLPTDYQPTDSGSYFLGVNMTNGGLLPVLANLAVLDLHVNRELVGLGINDVLLSRETVIPDIAAQTALAQFQHQIAERTEQLMLKIAEENKQAEEEFFASSENNPDIVTTKSGLRYQILSEGRGSSPKLFDSVTVRCKGQLLNGVVFDETEGESTVNCAVNRVIPGWTEALQLMQPGSKWRLFIPSKLGFGETGGFNGQVGPNQMLIYDVELVAVR